MGKIRRIWLRIDLYVFFLLVCTAFLLIVPWPSGHHHSRRRIECMMNLRQIGAIVADQQSEGVDIHSETGSRFLLQVSPELDDYDLGAFLCPEDERNDAAQEIAGTAEFIRLYRSDWRTAPCSYRGPDEELLSGLRDRYPDPTVIIACDMNGPDGDEPHHEDGVCVLFETGRVDFLKWDEVEGSDGDPVPVGPNSPDPRFRHLVP